MEEYIKRQDSLNTGREKINQALTNANTNADKAKIDSAEALLKAIASMNLSESLREQFNQIVIDGDSSVEAAAARVDEENVSHPTLKDRIDDGFTKVNSQLAETIQVVDTTKSELKNKRDKNIKITKLDYDLSKDINKWNLNDFDEQTRQAFLEAQGIDVNYILGKDNVINENLIDGAVTPSKTTFAALG